MLEGVACERRDVRRGEAPSVEGPAISKINLVRQYLYELGVPLMGMLASDKGRWPFIKTAAIDFPKVHTKFTANSDSLASKLLQYLITLQTCRRLPAGDKDQRLFIESNRLLSLWFFIQAHPQHQQAHQNPR